jgi:extradiol dioxygenase family protein
LEGPSGEEWLDFNLYGHHIFLPSLSATG